MEKPYRWQLCFSNPETQAEIIKTRVQMARDGKKYLSISPEDGGGGNAPCMCIRCRKMDVTTGVPITLPTGDKYVSLSDRYFQCFNKIAEGITTTLKKEGLDVPVSVIAYSQYQAAPICTEVHPNLVVGFVGLSYHDAQYRKACLEEWDRWASKAAKLYWRPNVFYATKGILAVYATDMGNDIKHLYQTGMIGTDIDTFGQDWATLGLNYYVTPRLLWDPSRNIEDIIMDYCMTGFGSAATQIRTYFKEVERLTRRAADKVGQENAKRALAVADTDNDDPAKGRLHWAAFVRTFADEDFNRLFDILAQADKAAKNDALIIKRIDFLRAGLKYTQLRKKIFITCYQTPDVASEQIVQDMDEYYAFLKKLYVDYPFAVNVAFIGWWDAGSWTKKGWSIKKENSLRD